MRKREAWHSRQTDPIFLKLSPEYRPIDPPLPPYNPAAAEVLVLPMHKDGSLVGLLSSCSPEGVEGCVMTPVSVSRIVDENLLAKWERQLGGHPYM